MAKEPAGLRRWRLAHRKKKHRVVSVARRRRSHRRYYGRKGKGRRTMKAIPIAPLIPVAGVVLSSYNGAGKAFNKEFVN